MTEPDLKTAAIEMLTDWIPLDEADRHAEVREVVERLWDKGFSGMFGQACNLAAGLHLIDDRIKCNICLAGFTKTRGMVGLIVSIGPATILPGVLAIYGDCGDVETWELGPGEVQSDLSIAKPAGAWPVPLKDVTTDQLTAFVATLIELAAGPVAPEPKRPWWGRLWGQGGGEVTQ